MTEARQVDVAVIDDDAAMREAIIVVLDSVGIAARGFASAQSFFAAPEAAAYRCLVMDIRMPGLSGVEAHRRMMDAGMNTPVVFITGHGDIEMAVAAMKRGAADFLTKPFRDQTLIDAVQGALARAGTETAPASGHAAAAASIPAPAVSLPATASRRIEQLTPREREILLLVARGLRSKQIAADLGISLKTVEEYRSRILDKMQVSSSCELAGVVTALGLVAPADR